jgi:hypothetical protein
MSGSHWKRLSLAQPSPLKPPAPRPTVPADGINPQANERMEAISARAHPGGIRLCRVREIRFKRHLAILFLLGSLAPATKAGQRPIDTDRSRVIVRVYRSGLFAVFAHDHQIDAPIASGSVRTGEGASVELSFETSSLRVLDPELSADTRTEIRDTMLGPKVLDAPRYPEIHFVSDHVTSNGPRAWRVKGMLTLHGQTHPVVVDVSEKEGGYQGSVKIKQSDFGITPIRIAGGTVRVKEDVEIRFDIRLKASAQEPQMSRIPREGRHP